MAKIKLTFVMFLWGSIGIFTRYVELSPITLAFLRALIALPVLSVFLKIGKSKIKLSLKDLKAYIISGVLIGLAWTALFYGYKNTSISSAIITYNMCPIYVMICAPFVLKERLDKLQVGIIFISFVGLLLIVGKSVNNTELIGIIFSIVSGILYSCIVIINRKIKKRMDDNLATFIQMLSAIIILLPIILLEGEIEYIFKMSFLETAFVLILGILHTGIAYKMYFSVYQYLKSIEIVSYSYLEPLFGIIFSVIIINEKVTIFQIIGGFFIIGSTYIGEYIKSKNRLKKRELYLVE